MVPGVVASELMQLGYMSILVIISVLIGQVLYRYASGFENSVTKRIEHRKHPELKYVLFDIFWAPFPLLMVFILIRLGVIFLPPGNVAQSLTAVVNMLLIGTTFWIALRTVQEVLYIAEDQQETRQTEA